MVQRYGVSLYLHMIFKIVNKNIVTAIYDDVDVSTYFILVTMAAIHEIQVLPVFNIFFRK